MITLNVIKLSVVMLSVVMLSVVMLSVVMPRVMLSTVLYLDIYVFFNSFSMNEALILNSTRGLPHKDSLY
jgi:hypothetical protein